MSSKKNSKKQAKSSTTEQRPPKRKKIVSLAEYEAEAKAGTTGKTEPAAESTAPGAAPTADVPPRSKKSAKAEQPAKAKKERKLAGPRKSLANAAVLVLAKAKEPMNAKAIVDAATANGWYEPGKGKTPHATLYSAMLREARETDGRFQKTQRGLWELTAAGKTQADAIKEAFAAK